MIGRGNHDYSDVLFILLRSFSEKFGTSKLWFANSPEYSFYFDGFSFHSREKLCPDVCVHLVWARFTF